jgi:hypothetical protein
LFHWIALKAGSTVICVLLEFLQFSVRKTQVSWDRVELPLALCPLANNEKEVFKVEKEFIYLFLALTQF